jgi:predicted AlkP superfamily phosphohydrolase/phosphomutase
MRQGAPLVVVLGLDGATWELLAGWLDKGRLPHLAAICAGGVTGVLRSTIPSNSACAWTSIVTGVNPGRHGVISFLDEREEVVTSGGVSCPRLWDYLGAVGIRCLVANIPLTYPALPVRGLMIFGVHLPSGAQDVVYPSAKLELVRRSGYPLSGPGLPVMPRLIARSMARIKLGSVLERLRARTRAPLWLMRHEPWDFCLANFTETDVVQHVFGGDDTAVFALWREVDQAVGQICRQSQRQAQKLGRKFAVLLISDHGFSAAPRKFFSIGAYLSALSRRCITTLRRLATVLWQFIEELRMSEL